MTASYIDFNGFYTLEKFDNDPLCNGGIDLLTRHQATEKRDGCMKGTEVGIYSRYPYSKATSPPLYSLYGPPERPSYVPSDLPIFISYVIYFR